MKAEVLSVEQGKMKNKWDGLWFEYQGEPYNGKRKEPTKRFVFGNDPLSKTIAGLKVGEWVDLTFVKDGKFSNLTGVEKISAPTPQAAPQQQSSGGGGSYRRDDAEVQRRISRSAALKEGVQIALATSKKTDDAQVLVERAKEITRDLERFLNFEEEEADLEKGVKDVDFEQIPFDVE